MPRHNRTSRRKKRGRPSQARHHWKRNSPAPKRRCGAFAPLMAHSARWRSSSVWSPPLRCRWPTTSLPCRARPRRFRPHGSATGRPGSPCHGRMCSSASSSGSGWCWPCPVYGLGVPAGGSAVVRARLGGGRPNPKPFADFDEIFRQRIAEADAYYADLQSNIPDADVRRVQRQAFAGMLWSKQYYYYDVREWLDGDPGQPVPPKSRRSGRNNDWFHFYAADVIAMPDKWEYPWFAAWDWAFTW